MSIINQPAVTYFGCKIETWKIPETWHPYPWRFAITHEGTRHEFAGLPNQCESRLQALRRAWHRAKWLAYGEFEARYA